ncbi:cysteine hydrolase family protein [Herbiconiux liangxiaofengii]|uniref:cysteine hydrolase family protein n=1 Tax=Herbiconiux liangxiaofengii TaxID=3342795 RepID=UPI0035B74327
MASDAAAAPGGGGATGSGLELDDRVALVVVDLQAGTTGQPTAHPVDEVIAHSVELLEAFRGHDLTVVLSAVDGTPGGRTAYGSGGREFPPGFGALRPELDRRPTDLAVIRRTWSAFAGTDLDHRLRERGITQVVLAGLATSFGVESTARQAYDLGYGVVLAVDAMTDPRRSSHDASVGGVFPALGQVATAAEIVGRLGGR